MNEEDIVTYVETLDMIDAMHLCEKVLKTSIYNHVVLNNKSKARTMNAALLLESLNARVLRELGIGKESSAEQPMEDEVRDICVEILTDLVKRGHRGYSMPISVAGTLLTLTFGSVKESGGYHYERMVNSILDELRTKLLSADGVMH